MTDPFHPPELLGAVPPPPPAAPPHDTSLATMAAQIRALVSKVDKVIALITRDPLDPHAKDGLLQVQEAQGRQLADHEARLSAVEDERAAEAKAGAEAAGKDADKWGGRAWAAFYDVVKMAGAAGLGAWIGKGGNP